MKASILWFEDRREDIISELSASPISNCDVHVSGDPYDFLEELTSKNYNLYILDVMDRRFPRLKIGNNVYDAACGMEVGLVLYDRIINRYHSKSIKPLVVFYTVRPVDDNFDDSLRKLQGRAKNLNYYDGKSEEDIVEQEVMMKMVGTNCWAISKIPNGKKELIKAVNYLVKNFIQQ